MSKVNNNQCKFCFEEALKKGMIGKNNGLEIIANVNAWVNIYVSFVSYYFTFPVAYQVNKLDRKLLREEAWQHFYWREDWIFQLCGTQRTLLGCHGIFLFFITTFFANKNFATNYIHISTQRYKYLMMWFTLDKQFQTYVSLR